MATDATISRVLAFLHELFPTRKITPATLDAWAVVFADWPDDLLFDCAKRAAKETGRTFFPTPGEISAYRPAPTVDVDGILRQVSQLGEYNPNVGWVDPRISTVREKMGSAVAAAYAAAGASACFADGVSSVTRDIARRRFAEELVVQTQAGGSFLLASPKKPPLVVEAPRERALLLDSGEPGPLAGSVARILEDVAT